jgi:hypothetical protein
MQWSTDHALERRLRAAAGDKASGSVDERRFNAYLRANHLDFGQG